MKRKNEKDEYEYVPLSRVSLAGDKRPKNIHANIDFLRPKSSLRVLLTNRETGTFSIDALTDNIIIGRSNISGMRINVEYVTAIHCSCYLQEERLFVRDLGSLNGTFINNNKQCLNKFQAYELHDRDILSLGCKSIQINIAIRPGLLGEKEENSRLFHKSAK